jgi:hypothetical protein
MRTLVLTCLAAGLVLAQSSKFGAFTNASDVGDPSIKGTTQYDAGKGEYRITGAGANIWAKEDQFQYVWREISGDVKVDATLQFLGQGADHRKAGIMLRKSMDTDSPYVDIVIHGNGMPGVQWRNTKGDITNGFDLPFDGPAKYKLSLVRKGAAVTIWIGKNGAELKELGHTGVQLGNPAYIGLVVCSHKADAQDTVVFSDVTVQPLASAAPKKK